LSWARPICAGLGDRMLLLQRDQNSPVIEQRCADLSPGSADRRHQFARHPWWTPSPLRPSLGFRYTQGTSSVHDGPLIGGTEYATEADQRGFNQPRFKRHPCGLAVGVEFPAIRSGSSAEVTLPGATISRMMTLTRGWPPSCLALAQDSAGCFPHRLETTSSRRRCRRYERSNASRPNNLGDGWLPVTNR
jgi:hypothetical protein